jgi:segregation and condensation protein A
MEIFMDVTFKLEIFEGPLDLLLHLISQNRVQIDDIPISLICEQYLAYLEKLSSLNIEFTSDFIVMAAQLILIKSKMLLPPDEEEEEDPRLDLARRLSEYKLFKSASVWLAERQKAVGELFIKQPEPAEGPGPYSYTHGASELLRAVLSLFEREIVKRPPPPAVFSGIVGRESESIDKAARRVIELLTRHGKMSLVDMLAGMGNRGEAIVAFLALLDLCKENRVYLDTDDCVEVTA